MENTKKYNVVFSLTCVTSVKQLLGNREHNMQMAPENKKLYVKQRKIHVSCHVHITLVRATCSHGTKKVLLIWSYSATPSPRQLTELTFLLVFLHSVRQKEKLPISASSEVRMDKWKRLHKSLDFFLFFSSCLNM